MVKMVRFKLTNQISDQPSDERDCALEISEDEILANGLMKKNPKDRVEVTIGTGMDLTVHGRQQNKISVPRLSISFLGDSKVNLKRDRNSISKSKTIGNSILDHSDFISHLDDDEISNKSYGSHTYGFKNDSHKGSEDILDEQEEKRDASKEELGIAEGKPPT